MPTQITPTERPHHTPIAKAREADVFIWCEWQGSRGYHVVACFNHASVTTPRMRVSDLFHYFTLLGPWEGETALTRVEKLEYLKYLKYDCTLSPEGPLDLSAVLSEGDYVCHYIDPDTTPRRRSPLACNNFVTDSLRGLEQLFRPQFSDIDTESPDSPTEDRISEPLRAATTQRYGHRCVFTGATERTHVGVHWIFPPMLGHRMGGLDADRDIEIGEFKLVGLHENLLPMHADAHRLWLENAFSVDVDNDCRIVVFTDAARIFTTLPSRLAFHDLDNGGTSSSPEYIQRRDWCLREHFRFTLALHLLGGDLAEQLDITVSECNQLYLDTRPDIAKDGAGRLENPDWEKGEKWESAAGVLVREYIMELVLQDGEGADRDVGKGGGVR